jgi:hypothetical protein
VPSLGRLFTILALVGVLIGLPQARVSAQTGTLSPDYGASVFLLGHPETTARDLQLMKSAGFTWAKLTVPWRSIEASCKNCIDWDDLDRVIAATLLTSGLGRKEQDWGRKVRTPQSSVPDNVRARRVQARLTESATEKIPPVRKDW